MPVPVSADVNEIQFHPERGVTAPAGFAAGAARGGIKTEGPDVTLLVAPPGSAAAAVFTTNQVIAAPISVSALHLAEAAPRVVIANSGNANCCTGELGLRNARRMCDLASEKVGCATEEVLVCSTGIIGHQLPILRVEEALTRLEAGSGASFDAAAARGFMTTDTVPKYFAASMRIGGKTVTVGGQAKGVGMIGPRMAPLPIMAGLHATMLAFLTTDAQIERSLLQELLEAAVDRSFNSVTVDGDTSTNDTAILLASGESGVRITQSNAGAFLELLEAVCIELAKKIARDGEGATKLVQIRVDGADNEEGARKIALTIANSPLVKTAIFGRDPNWGRIAMAAGRAGVPFQPRQLSFSLGGIPMFRNGEPVPFDQAEAVAALEKEFVEIRLDLSRGKASWTAWTCDFSYDYVKINAEYHT